jgi:hypothetical protein
MPKGNNLAGSSPLRVTVSVQSRRLLEQLAERGIYGRNSAEVAARFIDNALKEFVEKPTLTVGRVSKRKGEMTNEQSSN